MIVIDHTNNIDKRCTMLWLWEHAICTQWQQKLNQLPIKLGILWCETCAQCNSIMLHIGMPQDDRLNINYIYLCRDTVTCKICTRRYAVFSIFQCIIIRCYSSFISMNQGTCWSNIRYNVQTNSKSNTELSICAIGMYTETWIRTWALQGMEI